MKSSRLRGAPNSTATSLAQHARRPGWPVDERASESAMRHADIRSVTPDVNQSIAAADVQLEIAEIGTGGGAGVCPCAERSVSAA